MAVRIVPQDSRATTAVDLPWAVIGAGVHGLAAVKALRQLGVPAVAFEQAGDVGGTWNFGGPTSRVYESAHMITTRPFTQFPDFPMPATYPDYPSHREAQEYIRRYADHFGLVEHIRFGAEAIAVTPAGDQIDVTTRDVLTGHQRTGRFAGTVIANGHNWLPKLPFYPGLPLFQGEVIHAADYRSSEQVRGRRVLVVGAGNSGCDIAVEAGVVGEACYHSARRGYRYAPKYVFGLPADRFADILLALRVPLAMRRMIFTATLRVIVGDLTRYGVAKPDHDFYQTHPVVNQLLPYYIGHGRVSPKPDVERFEDHAVVFTDGSVAEIDMVVFATGYVPTFPFVSDSLLNVQDGRPVLARHMFSPSHPGVIVAGLIEPDAGQWSLAHWQGMLVAHYARARRDRPARADAFANLVADEAQLGYGGGTRYIDTTRHHFEVAHQEYLKALQTDIRMLEGSR